MITKDDLLRMLPRWKSGPRAGQVRGTKMKELEAQITKLKFLPQELEAMARQIPQIGEIDE